MSIINTGTLPKDLLPTVRAFFGAAYNDVPAQWAEIFKDKQASSRAFEEEVALAGLDLPVMKPEGESISYDAPTQMYVSRINHNAYASGIIITHEAVEDAQVYKVATHRAEMLGRSFAQLKNVLAANVLNRAFTSGYTGGDGVVLCATSHADANGVAVSNRMAVDAPLSEASLEQSWLDIRAMKDNRGLRALLNPKKLIVPNNLKFEADRLLNSMGRPGTADNDKNTLSGMFSEGVAVLDYLTDTNAWFVLTDSPNGLVHYEREAPKVMDHVEFDSMNMKFAMYTRYSFGWNDYRGVYGSDGE
jgi:hypothetical protein